MDKAAIGAVLAAVKADGRTSLTAPEAKKICDACAIAVPREGLATSAKQAARLADEIGFPVVMKIVSPDILHKTEAGGVIGASKSRRGRQAYEDDHPQRQSVQLPAPENHRRADPADARRAATR